MVEVSRPHTIRHPNPVGLPCTSDQLIAEAFTYTTQQQTRETNICALSGFRTRGPSNQTASDPSLRLQDRRHLFFIKFFKFFMWLYHSLHKFQPMYFRNL